MSSDYPEITALSKPEIYKKKTNSGESPDKIFPAMNMNFEF